MKNLIILGLAFLIIFSSCKTKKVITTKTISQTEEVGNIFKKIETSSMDTTTTRLKIKRVGTFGELAREWKNIPSSTLLKLKGESNKSLSILAIIREKKYLIISMSADSLSSTTEIKFGKTKVEKGRAIFKTAIYEVLPGSQSVYGVISPDYDIWQTFWDLEMETIETPDDSEKIIKKILEQIKQGDYSLQLE